MSLSPSKSMLSDCNESFILVPVDFLLRVGFLVSYYCFIEVPPVSPLFCSSERAEEIELSCGPLLIIWSINLRPDGENYPTMEDLSGSFSCIALSVLMFFN